MPDDTVRTGKIARWGNSAAVRLPAAVLEQARMGTDDAVEVVARDGEIVIRRQRPRVTLDDLLTRFNPEKHRHDLILDAPPIGRETL
ncbi:AbrB/MazE/SpoVT family DNA-binding domain-containing protein [Azospirillum sp. ST 5-10]|uniref:AbrB/MazE/SpoVT family DNA-binding domain-containing protein n=1 Tax=unclassified Azospirillum TaxID=2630922 RepID=UPI003F4A655C